MADEPKPVELGDVLGEALRNPSKTPPPAAVVKDRVATVRMLRGMAVVASVDPDAVIAAYDKGGPLAKLLSGFLHLMKREPGAPRKNDVNWRRFIRVVAAKGDGAGRDVYAAAAEAAGEADPDEKATEVYRTTYRRCLSRGWTDADAHRAMLIEAVTGHLPPPPERT